MIIFVGISGFRFHQRHSIGSSLSASALQVGAIPCKLVGRMVAMHKSHKRREALLVLQCPLVVLLPAPLSVRAVPQLVLVLVLVLS